MAISCIDIKYCRDSSGVVSRFMLQKQEKYASTFHGLGSQLHTMTKNYLISGSRVE